MYSPAGSGYGYSPAPQAPVVPIDRLNISSSEPHGRSHGDYGRADNGYVPGTYRSYCCLLSCDSVVLMVK